MFLLALTVHLKKICLFQRWPHRVLLSSIALRLTRNARYRASASVALSRTLPHTLWGGWGRSTCVNFNIFLACDLGGEK